MPIIDASIIVKLCIEEAGWEAARAAVGRRTHVSAPDHALAEVGEVLTRKARMGQATMGQVAAAMEAIARDIEFVRIGPLMRDAMILSLETGASVYDCLYVVAAKQGETKLMTDDRRLIKTLQDTRFAPLLIPLDSSSGP